MAGTGDEDSSIARLEELEKKAAQVEVFETLLQKDPKDITIWLSDQLKELSEGGSDVSKQPIFKLASDRLIRDKPACVAREKGILSMGIPSLVNLLVSLAILCHACDAGSRQHVVENLDQVVPQTPLYPGASTQVITPKSSVSGDHVITRDLVYQAKNAPPPPPMSLPNEVMEPEEVVAAPLVHPFKKPSKKSSYSTATKSSSSSSSSSSAASASSTSAAPASSKSSTSSKKRMRTSRGRFCGNGEDGNTPTYASACYKCPKFTGKYPWCGGDCAYSKDKCRLTNPAVLEKIKAKKRKEEKKAKAEAKKKAQNKPKPAATKPTPVPPAPEKPSSLTNPLLKPWTVPVVPMGWDASEADAQAKISQTPTQERVLKRGLAAQRSYLAQKARVWRRAAAAQLKHQQLQAAVAKHELKH